MFAKGIEDSSSPHEECALIDPCQIKLMVKIANHVLSFERTASDTCDWKKEENVFIVLIYVENGLASQYFSTTSCYLMTILALRIIPHQLHAAESKQQLVFNRNTIAVSHNNKNNINHEYKDTAAEVLAVKKVRDEEDQQQPLLSSDKACLKIVKEEENELRSDDQIEGQEPRRDYACHFPSLFKDKKKKMKEEEEENMQTHIFTLPTEHNINAANLCHCINSDKEKVPLEYEQQEFTVKMEGYPQPEIVHHTVPKKASGWFQVIPALGIIFFLSTTRTSNSGIKPRVRVFKKIAAYVTRWLAAIAFFGLFLGVESASFFASTYVGTGASSKCNFCLLCTHAHNLSLSFSL